MSLCFRHGGGGEEGGAPEIQSVCAGGHLLSSGLESRGWWQGVVYRKRRGEDGGGALGVGTCKQERGPQMAAKAPGSHSYPRALVLALKCSHFPASPSSRIPGFESQFTSSSNVSYCSRYLENRLLFRSCHAFFLAFISMC